ncbi:protoporphyrinogen oxidase [Pseudonocardia alaniniphila]|uniref:Coproporphyrinogen III oxidase n=1 Tax=Pseudonocardia alaniniphila TaxID=75291 RepID=A0ABS9TJ11_9PSEU|nr:protoporphyrinogen oxidase [Pseudonocardia alaniniphila]MCH6168534.1 protoporphyrinogen oxidase [Pseudonocardia alaniniphila]
MTNGTTSSGAPRIAVVGAGVSGLAAAHRLRTRLGPGATITVLEQRDRTGGVLRTVDLAGVPYDVGAEAFLARRPEMAVLLAELGLSGEQVHPTSAKASLRAGGHSAALPAATLLGVPTSAARLDGLLSAAGLVTVAAEPTLPLGWERGGDVALGGLLRERFGDELADRLADPLLGGVYSGRVDSLGLRATIPALAAALDDGAPSLTAAADAATPAPPPDAAPAPVFGALSGGYRVLLDALAAEADARLRLGTTVRELRPHETGWRLTLGPTTAAEVLDVDAVVLAIPAPAAARLLSEAAPSAARAAGEIELASSVVVALAYRGEDAAGLPPTSGALIATGEPLSAKAFTHSTNKWSHLSPDGLVRLRASLGRFGEAATLQVDDAELVRRVRADLATLTGITAEPVAVHVQRWGGGLPQYGVGHLDRVQAIEHGLPAGLAVAGSALHGVGVPACIGTGRAAADRLVEHLTAHPAPV